MRTVITPHGVPEETEDEDSSSSTLSRPAARPGVTSSLTSLQQTCIIGRLAMTDTTRWEALDVGLPHLRYANLTTGGQGKGSTEFAAHSHTPIRVEEWSDFPALVAAAKNAPWAQEPAPRNLSTYFEALLLGRVSNEENLTSRTASVLDALEGFSDCLFEERTGEIIANPDIIATENRDKELGVGDASEYFSPPNRKKTRRETVQVGRNAYKFPFETKPHWKFNFLSDRNANKTIISEWEVPTGYTPEMMRDEARLPSTWTPTKKKVFHVVRQLYGQMVVDQCRYGILHTYEYWFFCKRTSDGTFCVSRGYAKGSRSPSVLQAIMTMVDFADHTLTETIMHAQSAMKAKKAATSNPGPESDDSKPPEDGSSTRGGRNPKPTEGSKNQTSEENIAARLGAFDCRVYDVGSNVSLLTNIFYPDIVIKTPLAQRLKYSKHVLLEMQQEARMYTQLQGNVAVARVIPRFLGYSTHWGVPILCLEREMDDFDDLGLQNLPLKLRQSALSAIQALSNAGVLHNDLALRNFVVSRHDENCAKIIDLGRACFSSDVKLLQEQVEDAKQLLCL